jgi:hypothetical protein
MKKFDKREFNRLCAEFMGYKHLVNTQYSLPNETGIPLPHKTATVCYLEDMQYHSDWNWIMAVVDKIRIASISGYETPCFEFKIQNGWCKIDLHCQIDILFENVADDFYSHVENQKEETLKESVVQAIWQFLNWYEKNK